MCLDIVIDSRTISQPKTAFIALKGSRHDGHDFLQDAVDNGAEYLIVDQHWQGEIFGAKLIKVPSPLIALQEIARLYRKGLATKIIAITGTHGKTMTKDLLEKILRYQFRTKASPESFNSQIGVPLSLLQLSKNDEYALIELGFSKPGELENLAKIVDPNYAIVTHVGDKYLSIEQSVIEVNQFLKAVPGFSFLPSHPELSHSDSHFWDANDPLFPSATYLFQTHMPKMPYLLTFPDGKEYKSSISSGFYYFLNLLHLAIKPAWKLGIPSENVISALTQGVPEPMRTEIWESPLGTIFINDTYTADPKSIEGALHTFTTQAPEKRRLFLFGGVRNQTDTKAVEKIINRANLEHVVMYGDQAIPLKTPHTQCKDFPSALKEIQKRAGDKHAVLIKGKDKVPLDAIQETLPMNLLCVNLASISANVCKIRESLPKKTQVMAILKAFAYGTDAARLSFHLQSCGIEMIGVSHVDEAISLRRAGVTQEIFVLNATANEAKLCSKWNLQVGVSDLSMIQELEDVKVHLHVDTGMKRFGCRAEEALSLAKAIQQRGLILEGIMTHFPSADDPNFDSLTLSQVNIFDQVIRQIEENGIKIPLQHIANSSALLRFHFPQYNMVRIGLALFGLPSLAHISSKLQLQPALSLTSRIVGINLAKKGESVSYGCSHIVDQESRLAVIPLGYCDGMLRSFSGKGHVIIQGREAPMVGKICMDYMLVDITHIPEARINDPVLIFGKDEHGNYRPPELFAREVGSIPHELITCLGPRIKRLFIYEESLSSSCTSNSKLAPLLSASVL